MKDNKITNADGRRFVLAALLAGVALSALAERPWLVVNEDNDHYYKNDISLDKQFWKDRSNEALMTKEALEAYADHYCASGRVTHLFWCPQGQCPSYDSKVWDPIWWGLSDTNCCWKYDNPKDGDLGKPNNFAKNAKLLFDRGIDPYKVWIDRTRSHGVSPWISMRMNDSHWAWVKNHYRCTRFSHAHPELRIGRGKGTWDQSAMDYMFPEVREHHLKMFRELVDRYDADGLEMDFLRANAYFRPQEAAKGMPLMTEFLRQCRAYANAKARRTGKPYLLAMRCRPTPEACRAAGFDLETIVKEGLVDVIIPCLGTSFGDKVYAPPYAEWTALAKGAPKPIRVVCGATAFLGQEVHSPETLKAWAQYMHAEGAHDLYLFNLEYNDPRTRYAVYREGVMEEAKCGTGVRRFHFPNAPNWSMVIPKDRKFTFTMPANYVPGKKAETSVSLGGKCDFKLVEASRLRVNGVEVPVRPVRGMHGRPGGSISADLLKVLKPGLNEFELVTDVKDQCSINSIVVE